MFRPSQAPVRARGLLWQAEHTEPPPHPHADIPGGASFPKERKPLAFRAKQCRQVLSQERMRFPAGSARCHRLYFSFLLTTQGQAQTCRPTEALQVPGTCGGPFAPTPHGPRPLGSSQPLALLRALCCFFPDDQAPGCGSGRRRCTCSRSWPPTSTGRFCSAARPETPGSHACKHRLRAVGPDGLSSPVRAVPGLSGSPRDPAPRTLPGT